MIPIDEKRRKEIEQYLNNDLNTLYSILDLARSADESVLYMPGNEIKRSKDFLNSINEKLKYKICNEWNYCEKRNDPDLQDDINVISAIADVIATIIIGVPPILISTILFKKGLNKYCGCSKLKKSKSS